jgi:DNA-binding response OmpR family regulator
VSVAPPHASAHETTTWLLIDRARRTATLSGRPLELRRKEFELLTCLVDHGGRYVPRREITAAVWNDGSHRSANSLNVHLSRLRAKFGERSDRPVFLHSSRDDGVMFVSHRTHTFEPYTELHVPRPNLPSVRRAA